MIKLSGIVVHGKGLGHLYGMPTANIIADIKDIKKGVYAARVKLNKQNYIGVVNIGTRPSVDNELRETIETYIIDFNEDIYGQNLELELLDYLRPTIKMNSLVEVKQQIEKDCQKAKELLMK